MVRGHSSMMFVDTVSNIVCSALMYSHRAPHLRVDVVDLDPYGTAAPFIDSAVQCVNDGGKCSFFRDIELIILRCSQACYV